MSSGSSACNYGSIEEPAYRLIDLGFPNEFLRIARNLQPPSPTDLEYLEKIRKECIDGLSALQKLLGLEQSYPESPIAEELNEVKNVIRYRLYACASVVAAWRKLPLELWDQIFLHYLDGIRRAPRAWHAVVLASPSIWSDFEIHGSVEPGSGYPLVNNLDTSNILSRVNRFAEWAAPWSLTISARYSPHLGGNTLPLSSLIQYHSSLYSVIRLSIIGPRLAIRLGDLFLSSVASMLVQPTQQQPTHSFVDCFPHLPNLKRAVLIGVMSDLYFPHSLPWAKLTHLFLGNELNTQEVQAILRICASLHEACFLLLPHRRDAPWGHGNLGLGTSTLQHLTDLTIMRSNGGNTPMHLCFDHLSFPSLSSMKVFLGLDISLAAVQLNSCAHLTHLTLVGCQFLVGPGYHIGVILDACPLLEELVAPVQGYKEELYQQMTYDPGQPRGRHLRVLILLCAGISDIHLRMNDPYQISMQLMLQYAPFDGVSSYSEPLSHCFPISRLAQLVRSRRTAGFDMDARLEYPTQLRRFIFRFLENESGVKQLSIFFTQLRDELITSLQPFTATGLESSVEIVGKQGNGLEYCPLTEGSPLRHWDQGAMDFLDSSSDWVYSTAMPPQDALMDTS
ncbi:hypothetical protein NMY22_g5989 [Coprinellus aureogranulatus]|nr:hypothetical protein NMY22_g5989 [Coprinellus aureogranulatus]